MNKGSENILLIDIGTHKAEELRVLSGDRIYMLRIAIEWYLNYIKRCLKKQLGMGFQEYGSGEYKYSPREIDHGKLYARVIQGGRNLLRGTRVVAVDPQYSIARAAIEKLSVQNITYLPIAVQNHQDTEQAALKKIYMGVNSLSAGLVLEEELRTATMLCPTFRADYLLMRLVEEGEIKEGDEVVLRMNCEGSELEALKGCMQVGLRVRLILGSINDVEKKFGKEKSEELRDLILSNNIKYVYFKGSDPGTWSTGRAELRQLLKAQA